MYINAYTQCQASLYFDNMTIAAFYNVVMQSNATWESPIRMGGCKIWSNDNIVIMVDGEDETLRINLNENWMRLYVKGIGEKSIDVAPARWRIIMDLVSVPFIKED